MNRNNGMNRRTLLKRAGGAAAGVGLSALAPRRAWGRLGRNEKAVVALIGCGGMGNNHLSHLLQRNDVEIAATCDVYMPRCVEAAKRVGGNCEIHQDYRRVLDRNDIDAVFVATPDHWHTLIAIHGCQAWKDVYVEKPLSTTVREGRAIIEAARRYGRVVQVGIQQRSMEVFQRAIEIAHSGVLGDLVTTRCWIGMNGSAGVEQHENPPEGLDWDLWLGPAPWVPYSPQRFYAFRAFDDYAGGELTNWGPHLVDICMWAMKVDTPLAVSTHGATYHQLTQSDPQAIEGVFEFDGGTLTWSQAPHERHAGKNYGMMFQGTKGRLIMDRQNLLVEPESLGVEPYSQPGEYYITVTNHHTNFLDCLRTRQKPAADVEIGHRATSLCLLANIAVDCKRRLEWDGHNERFIRDEQANRHLYRPYRAPWHL